MEVLVAVSDVSLPSRQVSAHEAHGSVVEAKPNGNTALVPNLMGPLDPSQVLCGLVQLTLPPAPVLQVSTDNPLTDDICVGLTNTNKQTPTSCNDLIIYHM